MASSVEINVRFPWRSPPAAHYGHKMLRVVEENFDATIAGDLLHRMKRYIARHGRVVLGVPFGRTPTQIYANIVRRAGDVDLSRVTLANIDEYLGADPADPGSAAHYLNRHLIEPLLFQGLPEKNVRLINGAAAHPRAEAAAHEAWILERGGLDISLLGLGRGPNWSRWQWIRSLAGYGFISSALAAAGSSVHLAFNETWSPFQAPARIVSLTNATQATNDVRFTRAITLGLETLVLGAREVVVVAHGKNKRSAVDLALFGPTTRFIPASCLQYRSAHVTVFVDPAADPRSANGIRS